MSLEDLIKRAEAALKGTTEGPWTWRNGEGLVNKYIDKDPFVIPYGKLSGDEITRENKEFIAAARCLVPALVEALKKAERRFKAAEGLVVEMVLAVDAALAQNRVCLDQIAVHVADKTELRHEQNNLATRVAELEAGHK